MHPFRPWEAARVRWPSGQRRPTPRAGGSVDRGAGAWRAVARDPDGCLARACPRELALCLQKQRTRRSS